nr:LysR substrate-binding domain-containing protein [Parazoarcus communis]
MGDAVTGVALAAGGFGVCLVSTSATTLQFPGVVYLPMHDTPPGFFVDLSCIYRKGDQSPILAAFLETVAEYKRINASSIHRPPPDEHAS